MKLRDLRALVVETVAAWIDDDAPSLGAALAYYTLFSLAPLLVIAIAVAGMFFGRDAAEGQVLDVLGGHLGPGEAATIRDLLESTGATRQGGFAVAIAVVVMLIGSTTAFAALQGALDRIWRAPVAPRSGSVVRWIRVRLLSFGMVLGVGVLLLSSLGLSTVLAAVDGGAEPGSGFLHLLLRAAEFLASLAVITLVFALIYKFLPRVAIAWRDVWLGAAVTALLFVLGELLIGLYLGRTGFASAYGAAGSVLALLVWLYVSAQVFLLGAEFTFVYAHRHGSLAQKIPV